MHFEIQAAKLQQVIHAKSFATTKQQSQAFEYTVKVQIMQSMTS
jgi:hypothetical protein